MAPRRRPAAGGKPPPPPPELRRRLRQHEPGRVRCLGPGCDDYFESPDHCCIRLCPKCRAKQQRNYQPPTASTTGLGDYHADD